MGIASRACFRLFPIDIFDLRIVSFDVLHRLITKWDMNLRFNIVQRYLKNCVSKVWRILKLGYWARIALSIPRDGENYRGVQANQQVASVTRLIQFTNHEAFVPVYLRASPDDLYSRTVDSCVPGLSFELQWP